MVIQNFGYNVELTQFILLLPGHLQSTPLFPSVDGERDQGCEPLNSKSKFAEWN